MTADQAHQQLVAACRDGDVSRVRRLVRDPRHKLDVNAGTKSRFQGTPLTAAAGAGHADVVKTLLSLRKDLDPNVTDGFGRSAYYYALKANHADVLRQLNKDTRHRPSTVTQAMMECPLESVDPPLPSSVPAATSVPKKNNHLKKRPPQAEPEVVIYEVTFPDWATDQDMEDYILGELEVI